MRTLNLGFLASHGGSNVTAIVQACQEGRLDGDPKVIISNNSDSMVLRSAKQKGIPAYHLSAQTHPDPEELDNAIMKTLDRHGVDIVILAGYMKKIGAKTLRRYKTRILNIHPALLPKFGGQGMYGTRVHEAVLAAGEKVTGVTVHLVDQFYDTGRPLAQCEVPVYGDDTVDTLRARVLEKEHQFFVNVLDRISKGEIVLEPE